MSKTFGGDVCERISAAAIFPASEWAPQPGKRDLLKSLAGPCCWAEDVLGDPKGFPSCTTGPPVSLARVPFPFLLNIHSSIVTWIRRYQCGYMPSIKILYFKTNTNHSPRFTLFWSGIFPLPRLCAFLFYYQDVAFRSRQAINIFYWFAWISKLWKVGHLWLMEKEGKGISVSFPVQLSLPANISILPYQKVSSTW